MDWPWKSNRHTLIDLANVPQLKRGVNVAETLVRN